jgi:UV radiation resistance-associated gene protein
MSSLSSLSEPRRPRLLAQNRKLRHLKGLSLRNLSFDPPTHLRTSDDASLNKSPGKLQVLRESSHLHASRSSDSLRKDSLRPDTLRKPRSRRTSLNFAHANPTQRQKKMEDLVDTAVGDVFFSLHVSGEDEPVYISEVREKSAVWMRCCPREPLPMLICIRTSTFNSSS